MADWRERAKKLQLGRAEEAAKKAAAEEDAVAKAALLPEQNQFSHRIANEVVASVMKEMHEIFTDEPLSPVIEEHGSRTVGVVARVDGHRVAVNINSKLNGCVELAVFAGRVEANRDFSLDATNDEIKNWFGDVLASYMEGGTA